MLHAHMDPWTNAMLRGDFDAAWKISDRVLQRRLRHGGCAFDLPRHWQWLWDGRDLAGAHVLVHCYHGLGDTLQFVRLLPLLRARCAAITLWLQPELIELLPSIAGADRIVPLHDGAPGIERDADVELMELPHILRLTPADPRARAVSRASNSRARSVIHEDHCASACAGDPANGTTRVRSRRPRWRRFRARATCNGSRCNTRARSAIPDGRAGLPELARTGAADVHAGSGDLGGHPQRASGRRARPADLDAAACAVRLALDARARRLVVVPDDAIVPATERERVVGSHRARRLVAATLRHFGSGQVAGSRRTPG